MLLDKFDLMLMEELEKDVRQPIRVLARKLEMKRSTVLYRLNRLINEGILTIACIVNPKLLLGPLLVGINVSPGTIDATLNQLRALPTIKIAFVTIGQYNIMAWAFSQDRDTLTRFVSEDLLKTPEITSIETMFVFHWVKNPWKPQKESFSMHSLDERDKLDLSIITAMQQDPRQNIAKLAKTVGCTRFVAKSRLENLLNDEVIQFASAIQPKALGYDISIVMLIKCKPDKVNTVADELSAQDTATYVGLMTGYWQILFAVQFCDSQHMHDFISKRLNSIPGVTEFEIIHLMETQQFNLVWFE